MALKIYGPGCYHTCKKATGDCDACGDGYCCSQEKSGCPKTVDAVLAATKAEETKKDYCVTLTSISSGYYEKVSAFEESWIFIISDTCDNKNMMKIFSGYTTNTIEDEKIDIDLTEIYIRSGEEKCWEECHKESFCAAALWDSPKCTLKERVIFVQH